MSRLSYLEAIVVGAFQGVTELFPVSSLGHSVLVPALVGGSWARDLDVSSPESPYLAFIVGLHVATAAALLLYFRRDWARIVAGFATSIVRRRVGTPDERLAWLIILATVPVGVCGLLLEHVFRTTLGRPVPAAAFLMANGAVLMTGEWLRRRSGRADAAAPSNTPVDAVAGPASHSVSGPRSPARRAESITGQRAVAGASCGTDSGPRSTSLALVTAPDVVRASRADEPAVPTTQARSPHDPEAGRAADERLAAMSVGRALLIGFSQVLALLPGISRSGITMVAGLTRGLSEEDAARFSFLLATPVILAAGLLKVPDLAGPLGAGIHGQVLAGSVASFVSAYLAVRFLVRWFHTRTLTPFAIYCLLAGAASLVWLIVR